MALIACSECQKEISDKAAACPHCGAPTSVAAKTGSTEGIVTTQQTSKGYKLAQAFGVLLIVLGVAFGVAGSGSGSGVGFSGFLFGVGLLIYFFARVGAWWRNG